MSKSIDVKLLEKEIMSYLEGYEDDISKAVEKVSKKVGKEAVNELTTTSPKRKKKKICKRLGVKKRQVRQK